MFDLELEIDRWRAALAPQMSSATVDELENHLREEIEHLVEGGIAVDEAFRQACSGIGDPKGLSAEFAKLKGTYTWFPARLAGAASLSLTAILLILAIVGGVSGRTTPLLSAHVMAACAGYLISLLLGTLGIYYVLVRPFRTMSSGQAASLGKVATSLAGASALWTGVAIILGMIWARDNLGRYWAWDPKETSALAIFIWNFAVAWLGYGRRVGPHFLMLFAVFGNTITSVGWFGSNTAPGRFQISSLLLVLAGAQLLLLAAGYLQRKSAHETFDRPSVDQ